MLIREALHLGQAPDFALEILSQSFGADAKAREQRGHNSVDLLNERGKQMDRFYSLVFVACSDFLSGLESVLGLHSHFVETQHVPSQKVRFKRKGGRRLRQPPMLSQRGNRRGVLSSKYDYLPAAAAAAAVG